MTQIPSRIPENRESWRMLMAEPVALSTNTDTYSPAYTHTHTQLIQTDILKLLFKNK